VVVAGGTHRGRDGQASGVRRWMATMASAVQDGSRSEGWPRQRGGVGRCGITQNGGACGGCQRRRGGVAPADGRTAR
jgi:hypothetical protein